MRRAKKIPEVDRALAIRGLRPLPSRHMADVELASQAKSLTNRLLPQALQVRHRAANIAQRIFAPGELHDDPAAKALFF